MPSTRHNAILLGLATSLALAGCAGDTNAMRDLAIASGVTGGEPKPAPDFVSSTRVGGTDYVPVGTSAPKRPLRIKTAQEVKAEEAELERVRVRNEARGAAARQN